MVVFSTLSNGSAIFVTGKYCYVASTSSRSARWHQMPSAARLGWFFDKQSDELARYRIGGYPVYTVVPAFENVN